LVTLLIRTRGVRPTVSRMVGAICFMGTITNVDAS
jgi:hypothetical protein